MRRPIGLAPYLVVSLMALSACRSSEAGSASAKPSAVEPKASQTATPQPKAEAPAGFNCGEPAKGAPSLTLVRVARGLRRPLYLAPVPGDAEALVIVEQDGKVRLLRDGQLQHDVIDVSSQIVTDNNEQGLLGLAFHPDFQSNRRVFLHYSAAGGSVAGHTVPRGAGVTVEWKLSPALKAIAGSERLLLFVPQPEGNHNGGNLQFGPDGFLYLGMGDGGGAGDQHGEIGNGQANDTLLGKMLRIDVNSKTGDLPYGIPKGNMAEVTGVKVPPEVWSKGWRNPWRFSFDACTGDMYAGDVGQKLIEEVDFEPAGTPAGSNYGWRRLEATQCFEPSSGCEEFAKMTRLPVASYGRDKGVSITGGYVYRGHDIPALRGTYLYADFQSARFFSFKMVDGVATEQAELTDTLNSIGAEQITSFGQDLAGELYVLDRTGEVFRISSAD